MASEWVPTRVARVCETAAVRLGYGLSANPNRGTQTSGQEEVGSGIGIRDFLPPDYPHRRHFRWLAELVRIVENAPATTAERLFGTCPERLYARSREMEARDELSDHVVEEVRASAWALITRALEDPEFRAAAEDRERAGRLQEFEESPREEKLKCYLSSKRWDGDVVLSRPDPRKPWKKAVEARVVVCGKGDEARFGVRVSGTQTSWLVRSASSPERPTPLPEATEGRTHYVGCGHSQLCLTTEEAEWLTALLDEWEEAAVVYRP